MLDGYDWFMGTPKQRCAISPAIYAKLAALISEKAETLGYAIGIHGSLRRDLDLIAVPWTERAVPAAELAEAVRSVVGGFIIADGHPAARWDADAGKFVEATVKNPDFKPHGRLAWGIQLGAGAYIDLSVMPTHETH